MKTIATGILLSLTMVVVVQRDPELLALALIIWGLFIPMLVIAEILATIRYKAYKVLLSATLKSMEEIKDEINKAVEPILEDEDESDCFCGECDKEEEDIPVGTQIKALMQAVVLLIEKVQALEAKAEVKPDVKPEGKKESKVLPVKSEKKTK